MTATPSIEAPVHFGTAGDLFGLFLASLRRSSHAVLLCPPLGQDMIRSHRIYRQLARALAAEGIPTLRFDYFGSGDSAGESQQLDWQRCLADVGEAATELRSRSGCDEVVAFGARLGGTLAIEAASSAGFAKIVAWDPIIDGSRHVTCQDALQQYLQADSYRFVQPRTSDIPQWSGFPVPTAWRQQLTTLHVAPPAVPMRVLDSGTLDAQQREQMLGAGVQTTTLQQPISWDDPERIELAILSRELIDQAGAALRVVR